MTIKLTKDNVRTLPAGASGDAIYPDSDARNGVPGLYLRVRAGGSRSFIIQWRQGSLQRRCTIGKAGVLSLDEARKAARKALVGIDEGNDPIAAKAKSRASDGQVFLKVAEEYLEARTADMRPRSLVACRQHLQKFFKPLHTLPVARIDRALIASELRTIAKEHGPIAADRGRGTLSAFYGWCIGEGLAEINPVIGTNKSGAEKQRERVLSDAELVAVWNGCPESDYGRIVKLLMLTGQRRDEIAGMRRDELSDATLSLPASRTKNGRPHDVPLSMQVATVLDSQPERAESAGPLELANSMQRHPNGQFQKGTGGRVQGSRNKLQGTFFDALLKHWDEVGSAAIDIVFKESPKDYLKIVASVLPRELIVSDNKLQSMTDEQVADYLEHVRQELAGRHDEAKH